MERQEEVIAVEPSALIGQRPPDAALAIQAAAEALPLAASGRREEPALRLACIARHAD